MKTLVRNPDTHLLKVLQQSEEHAPTFPSSKQEAHWWFVQHPSFLLDVLWTTTVPGTMVLLFCTSI